MLLALPEPSRRRRRAAQQPAPSRSLPAPGTDQTVEFTADQVTYDSGADIVTALGAVRMAREGNYLAADQVVWNRKTDEVRAAGILSCMTPEGDKLVGEDVVLTDTFKEGTIDNLLVVLENGGRIAASAEPGRRVTILENAIYSPCPVTTETGCPKRPSWAITAAQVIDDPPQDRVRFVAAGCQSSASPCPCCPSSTSRDGRRGGRDRLPVPDISLSHSEGS